jgi:hypothetical protein
LWLEKLINLKDVDERKTILNDLKNISILANFSDTDVWERIFTLLNNISCIESAEDKNSIINCGIFNIVHKKLLEISQFPPPQKMISSDYYLISRIVFGIDHLLISNSSGVTSFLNAPLIPRLLHILHSTISVNENTSSDEENIRNIQLYICKCFLRCSIHCYEDILLLIEIEVIDSLLNIIKIYTMK